MLTGACGQARDPLLGKWSNNDGSETLEFLADGKGLATDRDGTAMTTGWQKLDGHRVMLTLALGIGASGCIAGDALQVRMGGSPSWYVRRRPDGTPGPMPDAAARQACAKAS